MRQTTVLFRLLSVGALLSGSALFAADPQLLNLVMPDAKVLAGVNVTSSRISPLGQFIISKLGLLVEEQKFVAAIGFDPLQDVTEVLAATTADPSNPGGLVLARGYFPVERIVAALNGHANPQVSTYGGATLLTITGPEQKMAHAVAFLGTSIAAVGDLGSVKAAVDRSSAASSIDPALAVKVNQLSSNQDEWLVSSAPVAVLIPPGKLPGNDPANGLAGPVAQVLPLFKSIQSFSGGLKLADNVVFTGEAVTNDPKNAEALNAVIRLGMTLLGSMTADGKNAQLATAVQLLQTLQLSTNGPVLNLSLSIPETQIEALVNSVPAHVKVARLQNGN